MDRISAEKSPIVVKNNWKILCERRCTCCASDVLLMQYVRKETEDSGSTSVLHPGENKNDEIIQLHSSKSYSNSDHINTMQAYVQILFTVSEVLECSFV